MTDISVLLGSVAEAHEELGRTVISAHCSLEELTAEWMQNAAYRRYAKRMERFPYDFWRMDTSGWTRRAVQVSTRKYRARRKRR